MRYRKTREMTRPKTISDAEILAVARAIFQAHGHAASTREIAQRAGISEGVLYQRFGSKNDLFFAAMAPSDPDLEALLGPENPGGDPKTYLRDVVARLGDYFGEVLPLALRVMTHPSFDHAALGHAQAAPARLAQGLAVRLTAFAKKGRIRKSSVEPLAQLLVSVSHDRALKQVMSARGRSPASPDLDAMVDLLWKGVARE
jgi:AcrR family transcriptional regulator